MNRQHQSGTRVGPKMHTVNHVVMSTLMPRDDGLHGDASAAQMSSAVRNELRKAEATSSTSIVLVKDKKVRKRSCLCVSFYSSSVPVMRCCTILSWHSLHVGTDVALTGSKAAFAGSCHSGASSRSSDSLGSFQVAESWPFHCHPWLCQHRQRGKRVLCRYPRKLRARHQSLQNQYPGLQGQRQVSRR